MTSFTNNLNLAKPTNGSTGWGNDVNTNWDVLDTQESIPYYGVLSRNSATVIRLSGRADTPQFVEVNKTSIDVSGNKDVTVGASADNLIEGAKLAIVPLLWMH